MFSATPNKIKIEVKSSYEAGFIEVIISLIKRYIEDFLEYEFEHMRKGYKKKAIRQHNGYSLVVTPVPMGLPLLGKPFGDRR